MATVTKDFRIKSGLVVEGTNGTINDSDIITADAITGGQQTNISVTYNPSTKQVSFAAENGVADSTTDDLAEGSNNLYFTDQRAIDAVGGSATSENTPNTVVKRDGSGNFSAGTVSVQGISVANDGNILLGADADIVAGGSLQVPVYDGTDKALVGKLKANKTGSHSYPIIDKDMSGKPFVASPSFKVATDSNGTSEEVLGTIMGIGGTGPSLKVDHAAVNVLGNYNMGMFGSNVYLGSVTSQDYLIADRGYVGNQVETHSDLTTGVHGVSGDVVGTSDAQTLTNKTMGDDLLMDGHQISGLGIPDQADHAATKAYVDSVSEGLHIHPSAVAATTGNINITNDLQVGDVIDGVTLVATNRVLVKNQTTAAHNGIYVVQETGGAIRATDFDAPAEVDGGDFIFITGGDTQADTGWVQTSEGVATIGLDPIYFTQFSGAGTFLAGNGLLLNGSTFEIDETITATRTFASGEATTAETNAKAYTDDLIGDATVDGTAGDTVTDRIATAVSTAVSDLTDAINGYLDPSTGTTVEYIDDQDAATLLAANGYSDSLVAAGDATATPRFLALDINDVAKEVAVSGIPTAGNPTAVLSWNSDIFPSLKAIVMFRTSSHTEISEILLTMDSSNNFAITEYGVVGTNGTLGTIEPEYYGAGSGSALKATTINAGTTVTIKATLLNPYTTV